MEIKSNDRKYDLDWIRVFATMGVFLYHCMMFFNPFPWHVKNNELETSWILVFSLFLSLWIMPLFFVISGINTTYSLSKRSSVFFIKERIQRLGIPLLFGIFILSLPQVYIERVTNSQFSGSILKFIPHYFDGLYLDIGGEGNFAFSGLHLWYLLVLLLFSIITIVLIRIFPMKKKINKVGFLLFPLILYLCGLFNTIAIGGWDLIFYLIVFLYGFYFFSHPDFLPIIKSMFKIIISLTVIVTIIYIVWFMIGYPVGGTFQSYLFYGVKLIGCWGWILVIIYLAHNYLSFTNQFLKYTSEASMPFYVLHQPIIVLIGYMIYKLSWPIPIKFIFLITVSFTLIMLIYHFVIKKVKLLRFLFGMKVV